MNLTLNKRVTNWTISSFWARQEVSVQPHCVFCCSLSELWPILCRLKLKSEIATLIKYVLNLEHNSSDLAIANNCDLCLYILSTRQVIKRAMSRKYGIYDKLYIKALGPPALVRHAKDVGPTSWVLARGGGQDWRTCRFSQLPFSAKWGRHRESKGSYNVPGWQGPTVWHDVWGEGGREEGETAARSGMWTVDCGTSKSLKYIRSGTICYKRCTMTPAAWI